MKTVHLARGLTLPAAELATEVIASLGMRGSGKSNGAGVIAEGLLTAGMQVIVLDHVGLWWSLRLDDSGKRPSPFKIPVLGGQHGDLALVATTGGVVAEALARSGSSAVLDVSNFSKGDRCRFAADFAEAFFTAKKLHPGPVQILLEEAQRYCLSADTEVLTPQGWKGYTSLQIGQQVVGYDLMTGAYTHEAILDVIVREHDGAMIQLKTKGLDCLVTPEHRVVLRRIQRGAGRYRKYDWTFCPAADVPSCVQIPTGGAPAGSGLPGLDLETARILGWVLTDGALHDNQRDYLVVDQSSVTTKMGIPIAEAMRSVLAPLGATVHSRTRDKGGLQNTFYLGAALSTRLFEWLDRSDIHRVPRRIMEGASVEQLEALFQGLMEGDGTAVKGRWVKFYPGKSDGLADDFQEVAARLGIVTTKRWANSEQWHVHIARRKAHHVRRVHHCTYKGTVWDITVPSGAFVARRNGTVFVTGNCPQKLFSGQGLERMLGAFEEIAEVGRNYGVGLHLISQRPQKINKDVLNLADTVLAYRSNGVLERKAISEWVQEKGAEGRKDVHDELPGLPRGTAIVWSPNRSIYGRFAIDKKATYDAGATPTHARAAVKTQRLDLDQLEAAMGAAVEQAKANDPRALKTRIAELERELAKRPTARATGSPRIVKVDVPALGKRDQQLIRRLEQRYSELRDQLDRTQRVESGLRAEAKTLSDRLGELVHGLAVARAKSAQVDWTEDDVKQELRPIRGNGDGRRRTDAPAVVPQTPVKVTFPKRAAQLADAPDDGDTHVPEKCQRMIGALQQGLMMGLTSMPFRNVAVIAGVSPSSGTTSNRKGFLKTHGFITVSGDYVQLTEKGRRYDVNAALPPSDPHDLLAFWKREIGTEKIARMLEVVVQQGPITSEALREAIGMENSGTFSNYKGALIGRGLIEKQGDVYVANRVFT